MEGQDVPSITGAAVIAVLDACVLYPPSLRDFLMWLAVGSVYEPRLTDAIHDEWTRNLLAHQPHLSRERLARTRALMNALTPQTVVRDYEHHIPTLSLPDPEDRHVLAAAIQAGASVIVTFNLRDFPASALSPYGIVAQSPDDFVSGLMAQDGLREQIIAMAQRNQQNLKNPPKTIVEYLDTLRQNQMPRTAAQLEIALLHTL
jgi:hypothetical protein